MPRGAGFVGVHLQHPAHVASERFVPGTLYVQCCGAALHCAWHAASDDVTAAMAHPWAQLGCWLHDTVPVQQCPAAAHDCSHVRGLGGGVGGAGSMHTIIPDESIPTHDDVFVSNGRTCECVCVCVCVCAFSLCGYVLMAVMRSFIRVRYASLIIDTTT